MALQTCADVVASVLAYTASSVGVLSVAQREDFVNTAIRRMEKRHRFRAQQVSQAFAYPAGQGSIQLPDTFIAETGVWLQNPSIPDPSKALTPITKTYRRFWIESKDPQLLSDTLFPAVAAPQAVSSSTFYYIAYPNLAIVPTPSAAITLVIDYDATLGDLTGIASNWFTLTQPEAVLAGALAEAYHFLHEEERVAVWEALFQTRLQEAIRFDETLAASGPPPQRGRG